MTGTRGVYPAKEDYSASEEAGPPVPALTFTPRCHGRRAYGEFYGTARTGRPGLESDAPRVRNRMPIVCQELPSETA